MKVKEKFKKYYILFLVVLPTLLVSYNACGQDTITSQNSESIPINNNSVTFKMIGSLDEQVNYELLDSLKHAATIDEKNQVLKKLAYYNIQIGNADSILFYGNSMKFLIDNNLDKLKSPKINLSETYHIIAQGNTLKGLYDESIKNNLLGIDLARSINDSTEYYIHQAGLAKNYALKGNYDKATPIYNFCLKYDHLSKNTLREIYSGIAYIQLKAGKYEDATFYYNKALNLAKETNNLKEELNIKMRMGFTEESKENYPFALNLYEEIKILTLENNFYDLHIDSQNRMGIVYAKMGNYEIAKMVLGTAYINAVNWNKLDQQISLLSNTKKLYLLDDDYENAYAIMTQLEGIKRKMDKNQNLKQVRELEIKHETLQKENKIIQLQNEQFIKNSIIDKQKMTRNIILIAFLIILIPSISLIYVYYQKLMTQSELSKKQEQISKQNISSLIKTQELKLIKASMDGQNQERFRIARELHDSIGGNMASIKMSVSNLEQKDELYNQITNQIDETYLMVRDLSHNLIPKKFTKNAFTSLITEYFDTINKSSEISTNFASHSEELLNEIDENYQVELYKVIQELTTNTLKHAKATQIDIEINIVDHILKMFFEDNGIGFDLKKAYNGIGLSNILGRIKELNGELNIDSNPNRGSLFIVDIPLEV